MGSKTMIDGGHEGPYINPFKHGQEDKHQMALFHYSIDAKAKPQKLSASLCPSLDTNFIPAMITNRHSPLH